MTLTARSPGLIRLSVSRKAKGWCAGDPRRGGGHTKTAAIFGLFCFVVDARVSPQCSIASRGRRSPTYVRCAAYVRLAQQVDIRMQGYHHSHSRAEEALSLTDTAAPMSPLRRLVPPMLGTASRSASAQSIEIRQYVGRWLSGLGLGRWSTCVSTHPSHTSPLSSFLSLSLSRYGDDKVDETSFNLLKVRSDF